MRALVLPALAHIDYLIVTHSKAEVGSFARFSSRQPRSERHPLESAQVIHGPDDLRPMEFMLGPHRRALPGLQTGWQSTAFSGKLFKPQLPSEAPGALKEVTKLAKAREKTAVEHP